MIQPQRYTIGAIDNTGKQGLFPDEKGDLVKYENFVELIAHAIEGSANKEFLERQVPDLKKALVEILKIASAEGFDDIVDIASVALSK